MNLLDKFNLTFDKMTEQLWLDFLKNQPQKINQLD